MASFVQKVLDEVLFVINNQIQKVQAQQNQGQVEVGRVQEQNKELKEEMREQ